MLSVEYLIQEKDSALTSEVILQQDASAISSQYQQGGQLENIASRTFPVEEAFYAHAYSFPWKELSY
jgi:hypothetical protein